MVCNLNTLINKKCINHTPTKPPRKIQWGVPFQWSHRLTAYNFPKNKPPKRHFLQSLLKREEDCLFRTSFVDTSDRDIILKQKLVNITVASENENYISFGKPSVFEIKSSIDSKNNLLLFEKWILSLQLTSAYKKPTLEKTVYISARFNQ